MNQCCLKTKQLVENCFFQLRLLDGLRPSISAKQLEMIVGGLVPSQFYRCSSLFMFLSQKELACSQYVSNYIF